MKVLFGTITLFVILQSNAFAAGDCDAVFSNDISYQQVQTSLETTTDGALFGSPDGRLTMCFLGATVGKRWNEGEAAGLYIDGQDLDFSSVTLRGYTFNNVPAQFVTPLVKGLEISNLLKVVNIDDFVLEDVGIVATTYAHGPFLNGYPVHLLNSNSRIFNVTFDGAMVGPGLKVENFNDNENQQVLENIRFLTPTNPVFTGISSWPRLFLGGTSVSHLNNVQIACGEGGRKLSRAAEFLYSDMGRVDRLSVTNCSAGVAVRRTEIDEISRLNVSLRPYGFGEDPSYGMYLDSFSIVNSFTDSKLACGSTGNCAALYFNWIEPIPAPPVIIKRMNKVTVKALPHYSWLESNTILECDSSNETPSACSAYNGPCYDGVSIAEENGTIFQTFPGQPSICYGYPPY